MIGSRPCARLLGEVVKARRERNVKDLGGCQKYRWKGGDLTKANAGGS